MGSGEEGAPGKALVKVQADVVASLPEASPAPAVYPDWQMAAAYYGGTAGTPQAFFAPSPPPHYMWPAPHMIAPYGPSIPYPHMYAGMYPHPGMAQGTTVGTVELEGKLADGKDRNLGKSSKDVPGTKLGDGVKTTAVAEALSQSGESGESGTEGSTSVGAGEGAVATGKRTYDKMVGTSDIVPYGSVGVETPSCVRGQPATPVPGALPGKVTATTPPTTLNIGMDIWSTPHPGSKERVNAAHSLAPATLIGQNAIVPLNTQLSAMDERELKRQRRKQSNRESARRSRLRKQQECEDLAKKVDELSAENSQLRNEIDHLKEQCKNLESENAAIKVELSEMGGHDMISTLDAKSSIVRSTDVSDDPPDQPNTEGNDCQANGSFLRSNGCH